MHRPPSTHKHSLSFARRVTATRVTKDSLRLRRRAMRARLGARVYEFGALCVPHRYTIDMGSTLRLALRPADLATMVTPRSLAQVMAAVDIAGHANATRKPEVRLRPDAALASALSLLGACGMLLEEGLKPLQSLYTGILDLYACELAFALECACESPQGLQRYLALATKWTTNTARAFVTDHLAPLKKSATATGRIACIASLASKVLNMSARVTIHT